MREMSRHLRVLALRGLTVLTAGSARAADIEGSSDHPWLARVEGAEIRDHQVVEFDRGRAPVARIDDGRSIPAGAVLQPKGRISRHSDSLPGSLSAFHVLKSYRDALAGAGFEVLFQCEAAAQCGSPPRTSVLWRRPPAARPGPAAEQSVGS